MASGVDAKVLKATKFPPEFSKKVDMKKVNVEVMKKYVRRAFKSSNNLCRPNALNRWISGKISEILGSEDDVVIELCFNLLEGDRFVSCPLVI